MNIRCLALALFWISFPLGAALAAVPVSDSDRGFTVFEKRGKGWTRIGFLHHDEFFREQKIRVGVEGTPVLLRLAKKGNGPGHVDFAVIGNRAPMSSQGSNDDIPLLKLAEKDFDVIHVTDDFLELTFPSGGELTLAARVEGDRITDDPFRFPTSNTFSQITPESDFYTLNPAAEPQLLFSEETAPGTGHPWGRATASAMLKDNALHVRLDFESDNTLDGDRDYASLHLLTEKGIRTFTVNRDDMRWGTPHFGYTPGVPWQHKIYDFNIPLDELPETDAIEVAMSAYGTAAPGPQDFDLAYGSQNREYMAAYNYTDGSDSQVFTQRFDRSGLPEGGPAMVTAKDSLGKYEQNIAYDSSNNQFLVSWVQDVNGLEYVHRQLVSSAGSLVGSAEIGVTTYGQRYPAAAYSPKSEKFLVVWQELADQFFTNTDILGSIVSTSNEAGVNLSVCTESGFQHNPRVAYAPADDRFFVVWEDRRNQAEDGVDIYARSVRPDGTLAGISTPVYSGPENQVSPDIAHDPEMSISLVVWQDNRDAATSGEDIYGQILANGLLAAGDPFVISGGTGDQWGPRAAYAGNGTFLATWQDREPVNSELHGRFISNTGKLLGSEKVFKQLDVSIYSPVLAGDGDGSLLGLYSYVNADTVTTALGTEAITSPYSGKIFLYMPAILAK